MAIPAQILSDVVDLTNRPDLTNTTITRAIQQATLKEHAADNYSRDYAKLQLDTNSTNLKFDISLSALTRLRRIHSVREPLTVNPAGIFTFDELSADEIFDYFQAERANYYFRAGTVLSFTVSRSVPTLEILYYQYPDVYTDYQSWIATVYPFVIVDHAASIVFKAIGKDDEAAKYRQEIIQNRLIIATGEI